MALPLAIPGPQVRHELPGCVSEPVKDLFDGANTAFYAVQHFSDISNARYGVTVSATDSALVQYDRPRSTPIGGGQEEDRFEKTKTPITTGRMYLYLMDNMFDVNIRWDQAGPAHFAYSLRSHDGDWRQGKADEFGWDAANPLVAVEVPRQEPRDFARNEQLRGGRPVERRLYHAETGRGQRGRIHPATWWKPKAARPRRTYFVAACWPRSLRRPR